ncbi:MAG: hypothetical protein WDA16_08945 [Candidatus Thermoplasmatota archaeon]
MSFRVMFALSTVVLLSPFAAATWHGVNTREPDTARDAGSGRMFTTPDTSRSGLRVYFDAFPSVGGASEGQPFDGLAFNPNVGALGTRVTPTGNVQFRALLGVWKDCNKDGYVGNGLSALQTYRAELLLDTSVCPRGPLFNDGQWVDEYLALGMVDPCERQDATYRQDHCPTSHAGLTLSPPGSTPAFNKNPTDLYGVDVHVWGDEGAPGDVPAVHCALRPLPRGTTASTGMLLADADCRTGSTIASSVSTLAAQVDPSNSLQIPSRLDQHFPITAFGDPSTGRAGVLQRDSGTSSYSLWDCSAPKGGANVNDPTGGTLSDVPIQDPTGGTLTGSKPVPVLGTRTFFEEDPHDPDAPGTMHARFADAQGTVAALPALAPRVGDPTSSSWDASDATLDGVRGPPFFVGGDCDAATKSTLHDEYPGTLIESDVPAGSLVKTSTDFTFVFYDGYRGFDPRVDDALNTHSFPSDLGVAYSRNMYGGPMWSTTGAQVTEPQLIDRSTARPEGPRYFTFYAMISSTDISDLGLLLPKTSLGTYGQENCGTSANGIHGGWDCDSTHWWRDAFGHDTRPRYAEGLPIGQVVGAPYFLRDVDCYDGQLAPGVSQTGVLAGRSCV